MDHNELNRMMEGKSYSHFAEKLQIRDRCIATIRHQTDGSKNIIGANVVIISNSLKERSIKAYFNHTEYNIPYYELTEL